MSYVAMKEILQNINQPKHKCDGCRYKGTHQEMMFRPFGVCMRETNLVEAEKAYKSDVCPYTDHQTEKGGGQE